MVQVLPKNISICGVSIHKYCMMYGAKHMQKIIIVIALAVALFAVPALAQIATTGAMFGSDDVDVLAQGIFESEGSAIQIPVGESANIDGIIIGNDKALAFGSLLGSADPTAENNVEIKKNQQSNDTITLINAEQIKLGNREAMAFGNDAHALNKIKIVTNQMGAPTTTLTPTP